MCSLIKGCVGFSRIHGHLCGDMLIVRGNRCISVPLPIPIYYVMSRLWRRKNILGKILFKKRTYDFDTIINKKKP